MLSYSITNQEQYRVFIRDLYREMSHPNLDLTNYIRSTDFVLVALADVLAAMMNQEVADWYPEVLAILLAHRGLHVHAIIPDQPIQLHEQDRQLTVLAGDYFSSKYYWILVKNGMLSFVSRLANAIQRINEIKTDMRMNELHDSVSVDDHVRALGATTFCLFDALYDHKQISVPEGHHLLQLVSDSIPLIHAYESGPGNYVSFHVHERLLWQAASMEERRYLKKLKYGHSFDGKISSWFIKYNTKRTLEHMLNDVTQKIRMTCEQVKRGSVSRLDEALSNLVACIEYELSSRKRKVEEV
ncbi:heptaprenyl diphosphate synthase component 1 [Fodinisporobacter ferrooxydans]|uniref:Heptaprenyl diphosphate synthase component 1 n=1 Tax=Fodinisporobacter ferrooxydans TaxID=2901836 RepID=A0ABY4CJU9_9BACL|nr:heptaprenyl diphosphate synthase component 1 [Alicyclobacillaceae bacterium MYW30-H2]